MENDDSALKNIKSVKDLTGHIVRWMSKLSQYDCEINYKPVPFQVVAGILSRNIDISSDEIAAFKDIEDEWYLKRRRNVVVWPKSLKTGLKWKVCFTGTRKNRIAPLLNREKTGGL